MKYVIVFDIGNDRRRKAVGKACTAVGFRVQRSVYECILQETAYKSLFCQIESIIDHKKDTVRVYPLDKSCDQNMEIIGLGKRIESVGFKII
ncbi:CRISPR-associated protein, Cas2 family [Fibrobacter intestinalis]|uniref:CRISPR-associated endoribonuclease Cas2 n=1 Tax=Fibrobacter intestinalis TaxID=28122 RepID=A0A1M6YGT9_9BACT|nr:CRISPR-associated endonuclease Cas2 [Fibrobacter intestinalis]SHL17428.1 CRISPR-associated protein, Cas2 family [Fibrobacter intestinalis]